MSLIVHVWTYTGAAIITVTNISTYSYIIILLIHIYLSQYRFPFTFHQNEAICDKLVIVVFVFEGVTLEKQWLVWLRESLLTCNTFSESESLIELGIYLERNI